MSESTLGKPVSNTYNDGKGVAVFEEPIECVEENAFECCTGLQEVFIPSSVTSIGDCAFEECDNLKAIYVSESKVDFYMSLFPSDMHWLIVEERADLLVKPSEK